MTLKNSQIEWKYHQDLSGGEGIFNKAKLDIFNPEVRNLKYGSGIVSHLADFLRFLNDRDDAYIHEELLNMIQGNVDLELIDKNSTLGKIKSIDEMEDIHQNVLFIISFIVKVHLLDYVKC